MCVQPSVVMECIVSIFLYKNTALDKVRTNCTPETNYEVNDMSGKKIWKFRVSHKCVYKLMVVFSRKFVVNTFFESFAEKSVVKVFK